MYPVTPILPFPRCISLPGGSVSKLIPQLFEIILKEFLHV
jgi:hypothetical protein